MVRLAGDSPEMMYLSYTALQRCVSRLLSNFHGCLVRRHAEPTIPPRVTYALTSLGAELAAPLREIVNRLARRIPDILAAQQTYDRQR